jgi:YD repeat-containing protein
MLAFSQSARAQEATTYGYDALGRLVTTSTTGGSNSGTTSVYNLDKAGNRTQVLINAGGGQGGSGCIIENTDSYMSELPYSHAPYPFLFYVIRSGACASPTVLSYATRDRSAHAGVSYVATSGSLTLNSTSGIVSVTKLPGWGTGTEEEFCVDFAVSSGAQAVSYALCVGRESP